MLGRFRAKKSVTMKISLLFLLAFMITEANAQNVGIGTATPASGLEMRGTGLIPQLRITDATSGNSLVLQGGS